ncbi:MAG: STAS domain-containing protein [Bacteroidetes bacterium]|nr:STAS domain-containing protein [Bacteroidota bacterium]
MNFKISTKEILHIISLKEVELSANMTVELQVLLLKYLSEPASNIVLNLESLSSLNSLTAEMLLEIQQKFYDLKRSLVICCMQQAVEAFLEENGFLEQMNTTPTESEACDIVQMEEIERELFS